MFRLWCCFISMKSLRCLIALIVCTKLFLKVEPMIWNWLHVTNIVIELLVSSMNLIQTKILVLLQTILFVNKVLKVIMVRSIHEIVEVWAIKWYLVEAWIKICIWMWRSALKTLLLMNVLTAALKWSVHCILRLIWEELIIYWTCWS